MFSSVPFPTFTHIFYSPIPAASSSSSSFFYSVFDRTVDDGDDDDDDCCGGDDILKLCPCFACPLLAVFSSFGVVCVGQCQCLSLSVCLCLLTNMTASALADYQQPQQFLRRRLVGGSGHHQPIDIHRKRFPLAAAANLLSPSNRHCRCLFCFLLAHGELGVAAHR